MSNTGKKKTASAAKGGSDAAKKADSKEQSGQDSKAISSIEGVELKAPKGKDVSDYLFAADVFQEQLALTEYRIVHVEVPTDKAPLAHKGVVAGYPVKTGDDFVVKLNKGQILTPKD